MIPDKLYRLALLVMFILALIQIINFFNQKPVVIETKLEHLNPSLLNHQDVDFSRVPNDELQPNFYYKDNRYAAENKLDPELIDPLRRDPGVNCTPKFDWDVKANPGANNVYGDMMWHKTSPKMILESNCLSCKQYQPSNVSSNVHSSHSAPHPLHDVFNEPSGVASSLTSTYDNGMAIGALSDQNMMSSNAAFDTLNNAESVNRYMSRDMTSGLPPLLNYQQKCNV